MATSPPARRYASPLIAQRRARILDEVKKLIGEMGADGFTLRDLGQRAGVSVTTIYNVFGDKEGVIAHALREFDAGIALDLPDDAADLDGFLRAISDTSAVVVANRAYALALADLYFSRSLPHGLFELIRSMPLHVFSHWLQLAMQAGLMAGRLDRAAAEACYNNLEWAGVKDWGAGRIDNAELHRMRHRHFLMMVATMAAPALAGGAQERLLALNDPGVPPAAALSRAGAAA